MERVMTELANFFSSVKNAEVHLILLARKRKYYVLDRSVTVHEPNFTTTGFSLLAVIRTCAFVRRTLGVINPSVVLSFGELYNSLVILSTLFCRYKIFVSDRSNPNHNWGFLQNNLRRLLYKRAYGIISQTQYSKSFLLKSTGNRNIAVIGNPIKRFNEDAFHERENCILTVGRMIKSKRLDLLIKLFSKSDCPDWKLYIVGDGPERKTVMRTISELGLADRVILAGDCLDVAEFYKRAKIFAFTSNSEGFPNALGEAMRAGLVPISFNFTAGAEDLIQSGYNGYLVEMDDEQGYVRRLNQMVGDEGLLKSLAKNAVASTSKFDVSMIGERYYSTLIGK